MARLIGKRVLLMAVSVLALASGRLLAAHAPSESSVSAAASHASAAKADSEKLITNVKVFYNPVADQIALNFKLAKEGTVAVRIMDALGNEVLNLMNEKLDEGVQNLAFETAGKLSSGIYFVRVTSGTEVVVKRISVR